jgi:multiple sugar transport system permease protein
VLVLLGPALVVLLVLFVYPVAWILYRSLWLPPLSFEGGYRFAPAGNYRRLVTSPDFLASVGRTLFYAGGSLLCSTTGGLIVALALDRVEHRRLRHVYTTLVVLVLAIPVSILALSWRWILHPSGVGLANRVLMDLALIGPPIAFLERPGLVLPIVTLFDAWVRLPFAMLVFLAGRRRSRSTSTR